MATIDPIMTLGALVNDYPEMAREFERRGLDYCCGGGRTLADACAGKGLDPAVVAMELGVAATEGHASDWSTMGAAELVDHLEATHHRYLWDEMPRLSALVAKVVSVHGERHLELHAVAACYAELRADLEPHLLKEERVLFPMIRELAAADAAPSFHCGTLQNPISMMLREHDAVGELLVELRRLTSGYQSPADGCASYLACFAALAELEADTHLHIHKENNLLFPVVVRMESELSAAAQ
ncbi:MAG: iron-sulfur cluster repair di-iron protein [Actinomycetota bacterium]|nr:iron-sulfur cluster repair di-iron protein [Actinomycetota bacterium]